MDNAPFTIQKFIFTQDVTGSQSSQSIPKAPLTGLRGNKSKTQSEVDLVDVNASEPFPATIPGYFAMSTTPANIEDDPIGLDKDVCNGEEAIAHIAQKVYDISEEFDSDDNPELVVTIHGHNTSQVSVENWFKNIFTYVNRVDSHIKDKHNVVFLGYRWSSENIQLVSLSGIMNAILALPISPRIFLRVGFIFSMAMLVCMLLSGSDWVDSIFLLGLVLSVFSSTIVIILVILRLVVYFRDVYRLLRILVNLDRAHLNRKVLYPWHPCLENTNKLKSNRLLPMNDVRSLIYLHSLIVRTIKTPRTVPMQRWVSSVGPNASHLYRFLIIWNS